MATLQEQSDSEFKDDSDGLDLQDQASARALLEGADEFPEYADEEGADDYPVPPSMASDGRSLEKTVSDGEFADDETNPGAEASLEVPSGEDQEQTQDGFDIHSRQPAEEPTQPEPEGLSEALLERAGRYGLGQAQAKATYKTDSELEAALFQYDQQLFQQAQQPPVQQQQVPPQQQQQAPQQPIPPEGQQQQDQAPTQQELLEYEIKNAELYEEPFLEDLQGMSDYAKQQFARQQQELQSLRNSVEQQQQFLAQQAYIQQQEAQHNHIESFDKTLQDLGDDWNDLFGQGHHGKLDQNGAEIFNRGRVLNTVDQLMQMHRQQGRNVDVDSVLESALRITFPDRQGTASRQSDSQQQQQQPRDPKGRYSPYTNKPTGRSRGKPAKNPKAKLYDLWDQAVGNAPQEDFDDGI